MGRGAGRHRRRDLLVGYPRSLRAQAGIEHAREALREPDRPSYDDLLALANDVAMGNTEYDTLSSLAAKLIDGEKHEIGANAIYHGQRTGRLAWP